MRRNVIADHFLSCRSSLHLSRMLPRRFEVCIGRFFLVAAIAMVALRALQIMGWSVAFQD